MKWELLLLLLLAPSTAKGAFEPVSHGARVAGLGGARTALRGDEWAPYGNPACLPSNGEVRMAVEYLPGTFGLSELKRGGVCVGGLSPAGPAAVSLSVFGFSLYREITLGLAMSRQVGDLAVVGVGAKLYSLTIDRYGSGLALGIDLGLLVRAGPGLSYGCAIQNLNSPCVGKDKEALPRSLSMGICVQPVRAGFLIASADKDVHHPVELALGAEYCIEEILTIRIGTSHEPSTISAGLGIQRSSLCIDYAFTVHPDLGGTHCISLSFALWRP